MFSLNGVPVRKCSLLVAVISLGTSHSQAAERWISLSTSHFEMYTTNSEKQAAQALQTFEQVRYFFEQASRSKTVPDTPVRIIAFKSEKEYKPYRPNEGTFAYYQRGRKCDYIVMQDIGSEHHQAAVHEYTHLVVEHLGLALPIWLNEGLADLYSSLEPHGDRAMVGRPLPDRMAVLAQQRWIPLSTLFAVDRDSPYYNESEKMSIFYAQSWVLTHMLMLGEGYSSQFTKFLASVAEGKSSPDALQAIYDKTVKQVEVDLKSYLQRQTVRVSLLNIKLEKSDLEPRVAQLSDLQTGLALADLLGMRSSTLPEARARLTSLSKQYPDDSELVESLGYLAWQDGHTDEARQYFANAVEHHSNDPEMIYQYAQLQHAAGASNAELIALLTQVVRLKPTDNEARFELGVLALEEQHFGEALAALSAIQTVKPDRAFTLFSAIAYCRLQLKDLRGAREYAAKAKEYAATPNEQFQAENFLKALDIDSSSR